MKSGFGVSSFWVQSVWGAKEEAWGAYDALLLNSFRAVPRTRVESGLGMH